MNNSFAHAKILWKREVEDQREWYLLMIKVHPLLKKFCECTLLSLKIQEKWRSSVTLVYFFFIRCFVAEKEFIIQKLPNGAHSYSLCSVQSYGYSLWLLSSLVIANSEMIFVKESHLRSHLEKCTGWSGVRFAGRTYVHAADVKIRFWENLCAHMADLLKAVGLYNLKYERSSLLEGSHEIELSSSKFVLFSHSLEDTSESVLHWQMVLMWSRKISWKAFEIPKIMRNTIFIVARTHRLAHSQTMRSLRSYFSKHIKDAEE